MSRRGQIVRRPGQEHRQELVKLIKEAAYGHATWEIWDDMIYFCSAALSQPAMYSQDREDEYLRRMGKYDKKTQDLFPLMFAKIILAYETEGCVDVLGSMYMELELSSHWKGQYFTPDHLCQAMAKMTFTDPTELIKENGYITVNDPTCGAGALLIAFAKVCQEEGVNYQRDVLFVGMDIDPVVARMCHISMSLLGMPGYVLIGNTLLYEFHDVIYTPMYFLQGFTFREKMRETIDNVKALTPVSEQAEDSAPEILEVEEAPVQAIITADMSEYSVNKTGQLTLF